MTKRNTRPAIPSPTAEVDHHSPAAMNGMNGKTAALTMYNDGTIVVGNGMTTGALRRLAQQLMATADSVPVVPQQENAAAD